MKTFLLLLSSPDMSERILDVASVTARDDSGSFGTLAGAFRRLTALSFGLITLRKSDRTVEYIAVAGGVFYFVDNVLHIVTTHYVRTGDPGEIPDILDRRLRKEEEGIKEIKASLHSLDDEMLKRLAMIGRTDSA